MPVYTGKLPCSSSRAERKTLLAKILCNFLTVQRPWSGTNDSTARRCAEVPYACVYKTALLGETIEPEDATHFQSYTKAQNFSFAASLLYSAAALRCRWVVTQTEISAKGPGRTKERARKRKDNEHAIGKKKDNEHTTRVNAAHGSTTELQFRSRKALCHVD